MRDFYWITHAKSVCSVGESDHSDWTDLAFSDSEIQEYAKTVWSEIRLIKQMKKINQANLDKLTILEAKLWELSYFNTPCLVHSKIKSDENQDSNMMDWFCPKLNKPICPFTQENWCENDNSHLLERQEIIGRVKLSPYRLLPRKDGRFQTNFRAVCTKQC